VFTHGLDLALTPNEIQTQLDNLVMEMKTSVN
jgi:hypothetical protein